ncbi:MAG: dephospho-CoA kinase [Halieaceae bacterium]|jgi:dephospho-CoA kinase
MGLIIGVTGGIGSGKTAVSDRFQSLGITVVDADVVARIVVEPGRAALTAIGEHFGESVILDNGQLDRAELRSRVFANETEREWLNGLLHPLIGEELTRQLNSSISPYTILVSPLLIETAQQDLCDRILLVDAPEQTQIERASARDSSDPVQIRQIMAAQTDRASRLDRADDVIENSGSLSDLDLLVQDLHIDYLRMAEQITASSY